MCILRFRNTYGDDDIVFNTISEQLSITNSLTSDMGVTLVDLTLSETDYIRQIPFYENEEKTEYFELTKEEEYAIAIESI